MNTNTPTQPIEIQTTADLPDLIDALLDAVVLDALRTGTDAAEISAGLPVSGADVLASLRRLRAAQRVAETPDGWAAL